MTTGMTFHDPTRRIIAGVDTHKYMHVAVVIDTLGVRVAHSCLAADSGGYVQLAEWAELLGRIEAFGIEGTGSYRVGLTSALRWRGHRIVEVNRGHRQARRAKGKSDTADADRPPARAGVAQAIPKLADGQVETIRQIKVARDTAVKARTSAMITLKQVVVNAPADLPESLSTLRDKTLINRCAGLRVGKLTDTTASAASEFWPAAGRLSALNSRG